MVDWSRLLLASVASVVHVGLLFLAPLASEIADVTGRMLEGRSPPPFGHAWRAILASIRPGLAPLSLPVLAGFGLTVAAALLVPSFATGMLTGPLDDVLLVVFLLLAGRLAAIASVSDPMVAGSGLASVVLSAPALLLAALALALIGGSTGLDAAIAAAPSSSPVPLGLVALALALIAVGDTDGHVAPGLAGPMLGLARLTAHVRLLVWLDLVAALLPPWSTIAATAGPLEWLIALVLWPVKVGLLAAGLGIIRAGLGSARASWRLACLRAASLMALLSGVFVLIGRSLE